ncbi:DNA replication terminus site-binding protein [uncultured Pseudoalteromonas sp.]|uniref:DNA replication terminus site-binding protein n=1 Tax=uncultured Pseudoalteromonas sp. TaxID=114053 RepID=UPI00259812F3|nr:DNA replication terminus site-binding protein [uncultured Pseudoalteromonas sp.]
MTTLSEVAIEYRQLKSYTEALYDAILASEAIQSVCYSLPVPSNDKDISEGQLRTIEVNQQEGFNAISRIASVFTKFTPEYSHSPKIAFRLPGIIQLPERAEESIVELVEKCNFYKAKIKIMMVESNLTDKQKRDIIQALEPTAITLHIYRQIVAIPAPIRRVGFTWCNKVSMKRYSFEQMESYLNGSKGKPPAGLTLNEWQPFVMKELELLHQRNKRAPVIIKRPLQPVPMANISFNDERVSKLHHAHTPFIIFGDEPVQFTPLKTYVNTVTAINSEEYMIKRLYALQ